MSDPIHAVCPRCLAVNRVLTDRLGSGPVCGKCRAPLLSPRPIPLTGHNFYAVTGKSGLPVLVNFGSPHCGYSRHMAPAYEAAAVRLFPRVITATCDIQAEPGIAGRMAITGTPTLVLFRQGREAARISGDMNVEQIMAWTRQHA